MLFLPDDGSSRDPSPPLMGGIAVSTTERDTPQGSGQSSYNPSELRRVGPNSAQLSSLNTKYILAPVLCLKYGIIAKLISLSGQVLLKVGVL